MADTPGDDDDARNLERLRLLNSLTVSIPELPKSAAKELPTGVIRYRLLFAVVAFAVIVFLGQAIECARFCKDVHDVRELYDPFQSAAITLLGSAVAYYFTDRNNRST